MFTKQESQWLDAVRVPLIVMVVFIHENAASDRVGLAGMVIDQMVKIAVPGFFLLSGFFFLRGGGN